MPLTQTQLASEVAERSGLTKSDAKAALTALEEIVLEELGNAEKVRIGGVVQLVVRVKEATKPRQGRNPATGEEITISAKPASVALKARPLAKAKAALPSVQKARKRLALSGLANDVAGNGVVDRLQGRFVQLDPGRACVFLHLRGP
jgi:DNA-binding protein HU-beta